MTTRDRCIIVVLTIGLIWLSLHARHTGPEWSGASHVDGRP